MLPVHDGIWVQMVCDVPTEMSTVTSAVETSLRRAALVAPPCGAAR